MSDLSGQDRSHGKQNEFEAAHDTCGPGASCDKVLARAQRSASAQDSNCKPCQHLQVHTLSLGHAHTCNMQCCGIIRVNTRMFPCIW